LAALTARPDCPDGDQPAAVAAQPSETDMSEPVAYASLPPTPMMQSYGVSFGGLVAFARQAVEWLRENGDTVIDVIEDGFRLWQGVSNRDLSAILAAFASGQRNVEKIIEAIRNEFGLE
jgi:hypothetical protein